MKTRRLTMPTDGRVFRGSPKEILSQMRDLAFGWDDRPFEAYLDWLRQQMEQQAGVEIDVPYKTDVATRCEALVNAMVEHGLALDEKPDGN